MNIQNTNSASFLTENKNRIVFLFVLFILSSMRMFGQAAEIPSASINKIEITSEAKTDIASADTQIDFVGWFMGSRQSQMNEESAAAGNSKSAVTKKQIITSGITPNKVLYRTFMKRVISQDSAIA